MKIVGKVKNINITPKGTLEMKIETKPYNYRLLEPLISDNDKTIEIKDKKPSRTLRQNNYLWALLHEIVREQDGRIKDVDDLYIHLLQDTGARYFFVNIPHTQADTHFFKLVRYAKLIDQELKGNEIYDTYQIFYGSSTFDTKEMKALIDNAIRYADEEGIETQYWKELLKDE